MEPKKQTTELDYDALIDDCGDMLDDIDNGVKMTGKYIDAITVAKV